MTIGAESARPPTEVRPSATITPIRALPVDAKDTERANLLRRLAADRLRDLRDDGVTIAYIARMYGVEPGTMEEMFSALGPGTR